MTTKHAMTERLLRECHVGAHLLFVEVGFAVVGRPSSRRAVMRIDS